MRLRAPITWCLLLTVATAACDRRSAVAFHYCTDDSECSAGRICFADGCGDLVQGLRIEVVPNAREGLYAQDFAPASLKAREDLNLSGASLIQGTFQQLSGGQPVTLQRPVSVRAAGESLLIPGRSRSFEFTSSQGVYLLPVATGSYSISASAWEDVLPPLPSPLRVNLTPGLAATVDFLFPAVESLIRLEGRLLLAGGLPITDAEMDVQALEPVTLRPLSQPARVSSGTPGATGAFTLQIEPLAVHVLVEASPRSSNALVPRKTFRVDVTGNRPILELGNFGPTFAVSGTLTSSAGTPIPNATVYLEGLANGGGTFRTASTFSDDAGVFTLSTLRSAPGSQLTLWAIPPLESTSGILRVLVAVAGAGNLGAFTSPDKILVSGTVGRLDGRPANGLRVEAAPVAAVSSFPLPASGANAISDQNGEFRIRLDPAIYRLDFLPRDPQLPRLSRFVTIGPALQDRSQGIQIQALTLSSGRRITGTVFSSSAPTNMAPNASIRFYRLSTDPATTAAVLLAETVTDSQSNYSVVLPTH